MSFPVNICESAIKFNAACSDFAHFGEAGHEALQIKRSQVTYSSYIPEVVSATKSVIEKILYYLFHFKNRTQRLFEVSQFSLNWLRSNAIYYPNEFDSNLAHIKKIRPVMQKAGISEEFDQFIESFVKLMGAEKRAQEEAQKSAKEVQDKAQEAIVKFENICAITVTQPPNALPTRTIMACLDYVASQWMEEKKQLREQKKLVHMATGVLPNFRYFSPGSKLTILSLVSKFLNNPGSTLYRQKKTCIVFFEHKDEKINFEFDVKIDFFLNPSLDRKSIIVKTKTLLGKGGQRKVYEAFDLLNDERLAHKPFVNELEKDFISDYQDKLPLATVPCRVVSKKHFLELKCKPLSDFYLSTEESISTLANHLVEGLYTLHQFKMDLTVEKTNYTVSSYHGDIKPDNTLVYFNNGKWKASFSDFGSFNQISKVQGSPFFFAPEHLALKNEKILLETLIEHNLRFGQLGDVWALGLVLAKMASKGKMLPELPGSLPALNCYGDIIRPQLSSTRNPSDRGVIFFTQKQVDSSIDKLQKGSSPKLNWIWSLVKLALKVNYQERATAEILFQNRVVTET